ncbi:unnamed protein product, partial [Durusdinium trenchii]
PATRRVDERVNPRSDAQPPRPTTPCMNRGGDGVRRKRISSAGRPGRPSSSTVGVRMFQLESRLLGEHRVPGCEAAPAKECRGSDNFSTGDGRDSQLRPTRPASSGSRAHGSGRISSKLIQEAMQMCRQSQAGSSAATVCSTEHGYEAVPPSMSPPPDQLERPRAPTPEQTNHWLQGMEFGAEEEAKAAPQVSAVCSTLQCPRPEAVSPRDAQWTRPRSPTPTKMLAWGEEDTPSAGSNLRALYFSPSDDDYPARGDHSDGLINRLIEACQMDDVRRAFGIYERLRRQRVPLYEGVYKLIIECCIRTHQLGHGIQFYETLKSSGQRVSSRIVIVLIEACAREQHSEKVHALWQDWCQPNEPIRPCHRDVFMATLAALVRTMCPDLALELLQDVRHRSGDSTWVLNVEAEVQDLLQLVDTAASEAKHNGEQLGDSLLASYSELQDLLLQLLDEADSHATTPRYGRPKSVEHVVEHSGGLRDDELLLMEDVDLDLELAAM